MDLNIFHRSQDAIAQGALTNSKRPESFVKGVYPTHLTQGNGAFVWDTQGKKYIDFICGLGSCLFGYADQKVNTAIIKRLHYGATLSLGTTTEVVCAEKVKELFPFVDAVKFLKTGSEACLAAIRIARAHFHERDPKRTTVLSDGYHGWGDEFISLSPPAAGIPCQSDIRKFISVDQITDQVAAVIIEPVIDELSKDRIEWVKSIREACNRTGALLIFDEVITGMRFPRYSFANYAGIIPDLICLGKAMGNGLPIAVVGGKYHLMNNPDYFVSSTFAGETCSLAAATQVMTCLQKERSIDRLWQFGVKWIDKFNAIWPEGLRLKAYPTRGVFVGDPLVKALFFQEACEAGILFGPSWFINFSHMSIDDSYFGTLKEILWTIKNQNVRLKGEMPQSPFSQKIRNQ